MAEIMGSEREPEASQGSGGGRHEVVAGRLGPQPGMSVEPTSNRRSSLLAMLGDYLKSRATLKVALGADGVFPTSGPLLGDPEPIVVDANWLRDDILYSCRKHQPTTLITAAAEHLLHVYVAPHVVDEVFKHAPDWTRRGEVSAPQFLDRWRDTYLPLLRVVQPPVGLLTMGEAVRVARLRAVDGDDLPTATLALVLRAPLIGSDKAVLDAVYGDAAPTGDRERLRELLRDAGFAAQLQRIAGMTTWGIGVLLCGLWGLGRHIAKVPPVILLGTGAVGALAGSRVTQQARRRVWDGVKEGARWVGDALALHSGLRKAVESAVPAGPSTRELHGLLLPESAAARAALYVLARAPQNPVAVTDLAEALAGHGMPADPEDLADLLRLIPDAVREVSEGAFQLGWCRAPAAQGDRDEVRIIAGFASPSPAGGTA